MCWTPRAEWAIRPSMKTTPSPSGAPASVPHVPLRSSSIASAGYWPADEVLELRFQSGALYRYLKVPEPIHSALLAAESKGRYFNEAIRGRFGYRRA